MDRFSDGIRRSITALTQPITLRKPSEITWSRRRLITKDGDINFERRAIKGHIRYFEDIFTTLLDLSWLCILFLLIFCFILSWIIFAGIWYGVMVGHGDFAPEVLNGSKPNFIPCVQGVKSFSGAILYSIETQQTIGYGTRAVTETCGVGVFIVIVQSCFSVIIQSLWVGLVYTRLSRPRQRRRTLLWSDHAVIALRDGILTLQCRLSDMRSKSTLVEAHIRMYYLSKRQTRENEIIPLSLIDMDVGYNAGRDRIFLNWPLIIEHKITEESPLFTMDRESIRKEKFEILVVLEGTLESSGMACQLKNSFLPEEILWARRFARMIHFEEDCYTVDFSKFNEVIPDDSTPSCSAKELREML